MAETDAPPVTLAAATRIWTRVGLLSFGGPAGQIATMHRIVVEEQGWIDERRFLDALSFCTFLPGPEAQQLATYIGWLMHGVKGALVAGGLFILPGFVVLLALSALYVSAADLPLVAAAFTGLKPAVVAIVVHALFRIGSRALATPAASVIAALAFLGLFAFRVPFPAVVAAAGLAGALLGGWITRQETVTGPPLVRPSGLATLRTALVGLLLWWGPIAVIAALFGPSHVFTREGLFFSQTAVVTFGGAYAVLSYVSDRAVHHFQWLTPPEMVDGLALAETTPGPLILVLQFVGFLAGFRQGAPLPGWSGGLLGAVVTVWATFVPSFLFVLLGAPYMEWLRALPRLKSALAAISAAVVGVVFNLSCWFGFQVFFGARRTIDAGYLHLELPALASVDWVRLAIAVLAIVGLTRFRLGIGTVVAIAAVLGVFGAFFARG
jgi:chromate transporter